MRKNAGVFLSFLLVFAMVAGLLPLPAMNRPVQAAGSKGTGKAIQLVKNGTADNITGAQTSVIHFGNYRQSSPAASSTYKAHIKWRVLENANGQLFLLSDQNLDIMNYNQTSEIVTWETSTIRSWLNAYGTSSVESSYAPFIRTAFNAKEQEAIAVTQVRNPYNSVYETGGDNDTNDKIFLLSIEEVLNTDYGFTNNNDATNTRTATNTAYVDGGGKWGTSGVNTWWLRTYSRFGSNQSKLYVGRDGSFLTYAIMPEMGRRAVRPALKIDLSQVLFTSATAPDECNAPGGKTANGGNVGSLAPVENYTGNSWKLTLLDPARNGFKAYFESRNDDIISVRYSGAVTGTNEYISAIIVDDAGAITYYGRIEKLSNASYASGSVSIDVSGKMKAADKLYVFNEQHNGTHLPQRPYYHDFDTDYASDLQEIVPATIDTVALTLGNRIDLFIKVMVPDEAVKAVLTYSCPDSIVPTEQEYIFAEMSKDSKDRYNLIVENIPAKEMTETVSMVILDANDQPLGLVLSDKVTNAGSIEGTSFKTSIADYVRFVVDAVGNDADRSLAKALLNFGTMSQYALGYNTDNPAINDSSLQAEMNAAMAGVKANPAYNGTFPERDDKTNLGYRSMSLNLEGEFQIFLSFNNPVEATENGIALKLVPYGSRYRVVLEGILARQLSKEHTVKVTYGTNEFTLKFCALSFANMVLESQNTSEHDKNLAKALYMYFEAAVAVLGGGN